MRFTHKFSSNGFPKYQQIDSKDCGPTCLKIISRYYGKTISLPYLREICQITRSGSSLLDLSDAAEQIGFRTIGVKITYEDLLEVPLPCILHWNDVHFVVLYEITKPKRNKKSSELLKISDPSYGLITYSKKDFVRSWVGSETQIENRKGVALILDPTPKFFKSELEDKSLKLDYSFLNAYFFKYKKFLFQLVIGLFAASILQLILPFLTQSVVDVGIKNQDIGFVYLVLFAQLALFIGRSSIEIIRSWILLHLSTRINIALVSDFFIKLMKLPIAYFDSKMTGDILQRINDHDRIERIMTTSSLNVLFSILNFVTFGLVLAYYSLFIFGIFALGSLAYFGWIAIFLKKRKDLDYKRFSQISKEQSKVIELVNGMQTIKLHNAEKKKRWGWEFLQARLFKISIQSLALEQYQSVGSDFINELKNILITVLSAKLVIDGEITLGMMLAISYIVGQLNSPISQLINFIKEVQDAKISLERLSEIHNKKEEEPLDSKKIQTLGNQLDLDLKHVFFRYRGSDQFVLSDLTLHIPARKTTAIVGASGSGKTTLMKLLLKFYDPTSGEVKLGAHNLQSITPSLWRSKFGVVMQEDYIFNDTIANNIAVGADVIDTDKLKYAVDVANIGGFIEDLPLSFNTKIGLEGSGLSTGQKQRLLIARAVYKNPDYLFFDEATSALDANNEKIIMENLNQFFQSKTVVVIAHRLSTVKNAHKIIVLDKGNIVETGTHSELVKRKKMYFRLVKNQLELGG